MSENVTPRQRKAIAALVTTGSRREACQAAGVSHQTMYRWLRQPAFCAALAEAEKVALTDLQRRLLALGERAGDALEAGLTADDLRVRLRAADLAISRLLQVRELTDLDARVSALEERLRILEERR